MRIPTKFILELADEIRRNPDPFNTQFVSFGGNVLDVNRIVEPYTQKKHIPERLADGWTENIDACDFIYNPEDGPLVKAKENGIYLFAVYKNADSGGPVASIVEKEFWLKKRHIDDHHLSARENFYSLPNWSEDYESYFSHNDGNNVTLEEAHKDLENCGLTFSEDLAGWIGGYNEMFNPAKE